MLAAPGGARLAAPLALVALAAGSLLSAMPSYAALVPGRAQYTMHFDHYERVPQAVADEVVAKMA